MTASHSIIAASFALFGLLAIGCSTPDTGARVDPIGPDRASFEPVTKMLVRRCGTLDCHGTPYRNLRLYGYGGLRLDPAFVPDRDLTVAEVDANYDAVIGLEPSIMRDVVADKGAAPERLTLVRKARGTEEHKGKGVIAVGDDADRCLISWLGSATDVDACTRTLDQP